MFFAGRLARPPWETRSRVEALVKQYDRRHIQNTGERFRFQTIQSRVRTLLDLWDRGLRAREEGRAGPVRAEAQLDRPADGKPERSRDARRVVQGSAERDGQAA